MKQIIFIIASVLFAGSAMAGGFDLILKAAPWLVPSLQPVVALVGSARLIMKPLMTWVISTIKSTGTKEDDLLLAKWIVNFTDNKLGKVLSYIIFDLILSINLKALAKELKK